MYLGEHMYTLYMVVALVSCTQQALTKLNFSLIDGLGTENEKTDSQLTRNPLFALWRTLGPAIEFQGPTL